MRGTRLAADRRAGAGDPRLPLAVAVAVGGRPVKALLLDLDCRKGETAILPLLEQPVGSVSIRHKLEAFAAAEGLQL